MATRPETATRRPSPIRTTLDFTADGKQVGALHLPHSPHDDAWGVLPIPAAVIRNGAGPRALLMAGNHGDEYEGPIVLGELIRDLDPAAITGTLIVLPAVNRPAVLAGSRVSPIDGLNMNRTFPGDPGGSATQQISHYVAEVLLPMVDIFVDIHSGGTSLDMLPAAIVERPEDDALWARTQAAVRVFGAPLALVMDNLGEPRTSTATGRRMGKLVVGGEMGGGGVVSPEGLAVARNGVRNLLHHWGFIADGPASPPYDGPLHTITGPDAYVLAPADGVVEPLFAPGDRVEAGAAAARIHTLDDPARAPTVVAFKRSGVMLCRRALGQVKRGNCIAVVVEEMA